MGQLMEYHGYHAKIEYSEEDQSFFGRIIGINDVLIFDGETVKELRQAFHETIDDYLEMCKEIGKKPEKEYKGSFNIRTGSELHKKAALRADLEGISLNNFICRAIKDELNGYRTAQTVTIILQQSKVYDISQTLDGYGDQARFKKEETSTWTKSIANYAGFA